MAFVKVCTVDELGSSGIASFYTNGVEVLVVRDRYEKLHAFYGLCPHEDFPLADGHFDGATITCAVHGWIIDATTGRGISPPSCRISAYPLRLEGNEIHVDLDTELP